MKRWEYLVVKMTNDEKWLNRIGQDGWECIQVILVGSDTYTYFKRELEG